MDYYYYNITCQVDPLNILGSGNEINTLIISYISLRQKEKKYIPKD